MTKIEFDNFIAKYENFPLVEARYAQSSNVANDVTSSHAVTNVIKCSEMDRLIVLKDLIKLGVELEVCVVKGFSLSTSKQWTRSDDFVEPYKKYDAKEQYEVAWISSSLVDSEYYGNAGYEVYVKRGIVLRYPDELITS